MTDASPEVPEEIRFLPMFLVVHTEYDRRLYYARPIRFLRAEEEHQNLLEFCDLITGNVHHFPLAQVDFFSNIPQVPS